jgi:hypothetical protein
VTQGVGPEFEPQNHKKKVWIQLGRFVVVQVTDNEDLDFVIDWMREGKS